MRGSIVLAAGLLVTNIALLERPEPNPAPPKPARAIAHVPRVAADTPDAQRLRWYWHANHNGLRIPACEQFDPLATLDADVDPTPGREHVIGNRRFGVMMFDERGTLLAHMDPIGCSDAKPGDQSLSLSFGGRLAVHVRNLLADGEHLDVSIVERRGDELITVLALDAGGHRFESTREYEAEGRIVMGSDSVEVIYHGRQRAPGGEWRAVDDHCTWDLATRSSSCRTRAGARTPESE